MITGAVPVAPYCNFRSALGSPFAGRLPAAIPPPATLFEGRRSGYSSPSTVDAMIQPFSRFVNPFFKKIFCQVDFVRAGIAKNPARGLVWQGFCRIFAGNGKFDWVPRFEARAAGAGVCARKTLCPSQPVKSIFHKQADGGISPAG